MISPDSFLRDEGGNKAMKPRVKLVVCSTTGQERQRPKEAYTAPLMKVKWKTVLSRKECRTPLTPTLAEGQRKTFWGRPGRQEEDSRGLPLQGIRTKAEIPGEFQGSVEPVGTA